MEKPRGVDLPLPTPENDVLNEVCANVLSLNFLLENGKQNLFQNPFSVCRALGKQFGPLINLKYMLILFFQVVFSKLKNEKRKSMTDLRFSGRRKTNGPSIHALIMVPRG